MPDAPHTTDSPRTTNRLELPTQPKSQPGQGAGSGSRWFFALGIIGLMGTAGVYSWPKISGQLSGTETSEKFLTEPAVRQRLVITVSEDGNIESASNVAVKCEVLGGSTILKIIDDGEQVTKGQEIVWLDESAIETQLNTQRIATEKAEAVKIQAEQDYEAAKIAVEEYEMGTFVMEQQTLEANVKIALENLRGAQNLHNHTQKMFRKGFVTKQQLEADEFGVQRSELELKSAETALRVLRDFTKRKTLTELKAVRDAAAARMRSELAAYELEVSNLKKLEAQKEKCVIVAPQDGMVIYANERNRRSTNVTIEEGASVREQQTIIKLPDLSNMQVKATIHETKIEKLRVGMPAKITVLNRRYDGKVVSVANQPEPGSWFSASVKEYAAVVAIEGTTENLKPGMTAEVEIFVADIADALTVNVAAVVEQGNETFAWVMTPNGPEKRPVLLGRTNENVIEIKDGIADGEQVIINPRAVLKEAREGDDVEGEPEEIPEGVPSGPDAGTAKPIAEKTDSGPPKFSDLDKDGDGKLTGKELTDRMKSGLERIDTDKDQAVSASEWAAMQKRIKEMKAKRAAGGGPPTGE